MEPKVSSELSKLCRNAVLCCTAALVAIVFAPAAAHGLSGPIYGTCPYDAAACTSNDLVVTNLSASPSASDPTCDNTGDTIDLDISQDVVVQSGGFPEAQARYDIGFFVTIDAGTNQCGIDIFENGNTSPGVLDLDQDGCGDLSTSVLTHTATYTGIPCNDADRNGSVDPFTICESWGNNADQTTNCTINSVKAGTSPKCECISFDPHITVPVCGDGQVNQQSEQCDPGPGGFGVCNQDGAFCIPPGQPGECTIHQSVCGDGNVECAEQCDPGVAGEGGGQCCNPKTCQLIGQCGNGVVECSEQCDDGNTDNNDNCTNSCLNAFCGDGFVQAGVEQCDDANTIDNDFCDNACQLPVCGNGEVEGKEQCDDGNLTAGDGCSPKCTTEVPTMPEYGLGALAFLLLGAGIVAARKGNVI